MFAMLKVNNLSLARKEVHVYNMSASNTHVVVLAGLWLGIWPGISVDAME